LRARDLGPEVCAAIVAQVLEDVSTRRSVWSTWNLSAAALRSSLALRMASPDDRLRLTNLIVTEAGKACVRLDDDTEPSRRRVGEETYTSLELLQAVGLAGTTIHDLRHTAASLLIAAGADVKAVQMILGHATATRTMDLYGHLFSEAPWVAMERMPMFPHPRASPETP
jgi:site-specific recombinase XerC